MEKAHKRPGMEPREPAYTYQTKPLQMDGVTMAVLGLGALAALKGYLWVQDGETWKAALLGTVTALGLAVGNWAWWRWKKARSRVEDPILIQEKVSRIAFDAELQIVAVLPADTGQPRARELLGLVTAAYRHYDNPAGARFKVSCVRPVVPDAQTLHPPGPGLFGKRSVLGVREIARPVAPARRRRRDAPGGAVRREGAQPLGQGHQGRRAGGRHHRRRQTGDPLPGRPAQASPPLRRPHPHGQVHPHAPPRHAQAQGEGGRDPPTRPRVARRPGAPHRPCPTRPAPRASTCWTPASSPTATAPPTRWVRVAKGLWEQWGPRMQSILEQTVKTLHEANEQVEAEQQYTILDGLKLLSNDPFRKDVLKNVSDPYLLEWWARDFGSWHRQYKGRGPRPRADPPLLLRLIQAGQGHTRPAPLHHRHAEGHPRGRRPAGLHLPGNGGQGRGRPRGSVDPQPRRRRHPGAGKRFA